MLANDRQEGGDHYAGDYQHWDWVTDIGLHYLLGCASKYVCRWRKKNGQEDLKKALHYLEKAQEREVPPTAGPFNTCAAAHTREFTRDMRLWIVTGKHVLAGAA